MSNKRLLKNTGFISLATLTSRVFGFIRDILIANFFGTTIFAEGFVIAFRIPNLFRDLVGEGAANAAFVPVLTEYSTTRSKDEFWNLSRNLLFVLVIVLFAVSVCGVLLAPVIVRVIAPGFINDPAKLAIAVSLTRITFPFIFLVGIVAYGMGVLNSLNHFAIPALGPVLLNISMIGFLLFVCPNMGITGLAIAVLVGGALQVAAIGAMLYKKGLRVWRPTLPVAKHPAIKRIWRLLVPRFFGSAVYQLSVVVDNVFSTFTWIVGVGAPAALWYSYRLFHLPLAIFGIALATVALPKMSGEVARKDITSLKETISFSLKGVFLALVPASVGLATLGRPIVRILFERGEFTSYSTSITHNALFFYSFGLFACGGIKILVNAFFSMGDTKTPVKVASVSFFINLALNFILMWPLKIGGLALATSAAATFNFIMLYILLSRRIGDIGLSSLTAFLGKVAVSCASMGIFSFIAGKFLDASQMGTFGNIAGIIIIILFSAAIYIFSGFLLGLGEIKRFLRWILRKS